MPEDRPDEETLSDDERFDAWLEAFERKMREKLSTKHQVKHDGRL